MSRKTIEVEYPIAPNPLPALEGEELLYRKDSTIYDSGSLFPAEVAVFSAVRRIGGVKGCTYISESCSLLSGTTATSGGGNDDFENNV